jgi:hypothetical protein
VKSKLGLWPSDSVGIVTAAAACWRFECGIAKEHEENRISLPAWIIHQVIWLGARARDFKYLSGPRGRARRDGTVPCSAPAPSPLGARRSSEPYAPQECLMRRE